MIIILIFIISLVLFLRYKLRELRFLKILSRNVFIFGSKGSGKDLLTQWYVYKTKKKVISNIDYGYNTEVVTNFGEIFDLKNTFNDIVTNNITPIQKLDKYEGYQMIISDSSIYFPSHEDTMLKKVFPTFPTFYALSRQLYNMPILVNTQNLDRLWKSLREQVNDGYFKCLGTYLKQDVFNYVPVLRHFLIIKVRYYENHQSAEQGLLPFKKLAVANNLSDKTIYMTSAGATKEQYNATNGTIEDYTIIVRKKKIVYDSRAFHTTFFGYPYRNEVKKKSDHKCNKVKCCSLFKRSKGSDNQWNK